MEVSWLTIILSIVSAVASVVLAIIGVVSPIITRKIENSMKRKMLFDEINRYANFVNETKTFKLMSGDEKKQTIFERAQLFAVENEISVTEQELLLYIEQSISLVVKSKNALKQLEKAGVRLMQDKNHLIKEK